MEDIEENSALETEVHGGDRTNRRVPRRDRKKNCCLISLAIGLTIIIVLAIFIGLYFGLPSRAVPTDKDITGESTFYGVYQNAAVATDAAECSTIGKEILQKGGSAVDSAIAAMLCAGLHNSQSCGLGGGFFMIYYEAATGKAIFINARETAPAAAHENMFEGNGRLSQLGSLAVAVPGQVAGYWEAHQKFGKLPWADLFAPSIKLAENGFVVTPGLEKAIAFNAKYIQNRTFNLWPVYENADGSLKQSGDIVKLPQLARTLQRIAAEGVWAFYNGSLASDIVADLTNGVGESIITKEDLRNYKIQVKPAINVSVDKLTVFTPGSPSGGPVLSLILNILDGYNFTSNDMAKGNDILTYHRIVEAFKFAFGKRSELGDDRNNRNITQLVANMTSDSMADSIRLRINDNTTNPVEYYEPVFELPNDSGTSHISLYAPNGDAVSLTGTLNTIFGSRIRGNRTGIIFNNEMDDFSSPNVTNSFGVPPSPSNYIHPGNRPLSSMAPAIVVEFNEESGKNELRMIDGAAGGPRIITSTALTIMNCLWFGNDVGTSVKKKRLHQQLLPDQVQYESGFDNEIMAGLIAKGHANTTINYLMSVVQAILIRDQKVYAASDPRKGGSPDGF